jgi:pilus assembly protein Flp/PilA
VWLREGHPQNAFLDTNNLKEFLMKKLMAKITAWAMNKEGATAIEYGLIAAGISIAIVVVVFTLGDNLEATFTTISEAVAGG